MNAFTQTARFLDRSRRITANGRAKIDLCPVELPDRAITDAHLWTRFPHRFGPTLVAAIDIGVRMLQARDASGKARVSAPTARECEWTCTRRV